MLAARGVTAAETGRQCGCSRRKRPKPPLPANPFDFGVRANFVKVRSCAARLPPAACTAHLRASPFQIFGKHPILWLLPTNQGIEGNGIFYELSVESQAGPGEKLW